MKRIVVVLLAIVCSCNLLSATSIDYKKEYKELMFLHIRSGYAWLGHADISNATVANQWDLANEGYNASLSNAGFWDFAIGFYPLSFLDVDVSYGTYETMHYEKYQTGTSSTTAFTGGNRMRYFDVDHKNIMLNATLHPRKGEFSIDTSCVSISPFVGGGFGLGINRINNFHTVAYSTDGKTGSTTSIGFRNTNKSCAWQLNAGLTFSACNHKVAFDLGYRYHNGGTFKTGDKFMANVNDFKGAFCPATGWKGKIRAHEAVVAFRFNF
jgi:hypothetical protein